MWIFHPLQTCFHPCSSRILSSVVGRVSIMLGFSGLVMEEIAASTCCLVTVKCEAAVNGSGDGSLSPLYEASGKIWQTL